jgi:hypothetical protein
VRKGSELNYRKNTLNTATTRILSFLFRPPPESLGADNCRAGSRASGKVFVWYSAKSAVILMQPNIDVRL